MVLSYSSLNIYLILDLFVSSTLSLYYLGTYSGIKYLWWYDFRWVCLQTRGERPSGLSGGRCGIREGEIWYPFFIFIVLKEKIIQSKHKLMCSELLIKMFTNVLKAHYHTFKILIIAVKMPYFLNWFQKLVSHIFRSFSLSPLF